MDSLEELLDVLDSIFYSIACASIASSIVCTILFFKIWRMTNHIKHIHDWLLQDRLSMNQTNSAAPGFTPHSETKLDKLSEEAAPAQPLKVTLAKGDKVTIAGFGTCIFEGVWQGKYALYPEVKTNLPDSQYLINDVEPYLLIPESELAEIVI